MPNPIVYLIGGASRSGKSELCRRLSVAATCPYFHLDFLRQGVLAGIATILGNEPDDPESYANRVTHAIVPGLIENVIYNGLSYIIEGGWLQPQTAAKVKRHYPNYVKVCFVGFPDADLDEMVARVRNNAGQANDWLSKRTDDEVKNFMRCQISGSLWYKQEAEKHGFIYCDTSHKFSENINNAVHDLLN